MEFQSAIESAMSQCIQAGRAAPSPGKLARLCTTLSPGGRGSSDILLSVAAACGDDAPNCRCGGGGA